MNNQNTELSITVTDWTTSCENLFAVRREVFVDEMGRSSDSEHDSQDMTSVHVLATTPAGKPVAAGRLTAAATVDCMAVLESWRGQGVGRTIANELLAVAQRRSVAVVAVESPQTSSGFFRRLGFRAAAGSDSDRNAGEQVLSLALADWDPAGTPSTPRAVNGVGEAVVAAMQLIESARRGIDIYLPYVHPGLLGETTIASVLSRRVIEQSRFQIRLLLPPATEWRHSCPELASRVARLGALQLRSWPCAEPRERVEFSYGYWLSEEAMMQLTDVRACLGEYSPKGLRQRREVGNFFSDCWERSVIDRELRPLAY